MRRKWPMIHVMRECDGKWYCATWDDKIRAWRRGIGLTGPDLITSSTYNQTGGVSHGPGYNRDRFNDLHHGRFIRSGLRSNLFMMGGFHGPHL